jgi:Lamin Tail Domain/PEP-CTERM motif
MKRFELKTLVAAALAAASFTSAHAALIISEAAPYASGNTPFGQDWFELTNTGATAIALGGWRMDDSSPSFATSVPLSGVTSIAPGESVIFIECGASNCGTVGGLFQTYWGAPVARVQIGTYSGAGIGLSTGGDAINIFDSAGMVQASVSFGASTTGRTFDNAAGLNGSAITTLSTVGVNGAFNSVGVLTGTGGGGLDIGSPGSIAAVPEPETYAMLLAGLLAVGTLVRRRQG